MSNLEIKARELIITPKKESRKAFLDTFIFEPENIEEQNLGNLYIIGEITDISSNSEYLINLLVATIKKEYYSNTGRTPMESLEASLAKTNEMLADFAEQGNIEWIGKLHITIAVFKNGVLYFSQTGVSKALLVRGKNIIDIGQDLVSDPKPHPLKTFSNIASGQIDKGDKLILATSKFLKNIAKDRIASIVESNPNNVVEGLAEELGERNSIAAIILDSRDRKASQFEFKKMSEEELSDESQYSVKYTGENDRMGKVINELNLAEKDIPVSRKIRAAAKAIRFIASNTKKFLLTAYSLVKKYSLLLYAYLKPRLIMLGSGALEKSKNLARGAGERIKPSSNPAISSADPASVNMAALDGVKISSNISGRLSGIMPAYSQNIPLRNKIITAIILIAVIAISYNAVAYKKGKQEEKSNQYYTSLFEAAKNSEKEAEIAQMYQEDAKARDLIREALANIEKLSSSGYVTDETESLKKKILAGLDKLELTTRLEDPLKLVDFALNSQNIKTDGIVWSSKKLYAFNSANNGIYTYDFAKKTSEILAVNSQEAGHIKMARPVGNKIIFLTDSPGIAVYEPGKSEIENVPIKFAESEKEIADLGTFQSTSNLYLLAKGDNEIYKHRLVVSGYAKGEKWIKNSGETNIQNPISLAIDGSIYLLQNDGNDTILLFNKGVKKEFASPSLLVPLKKASKIMTSETMDNLYILDPENKRVVVMAKNGKLIGQFVSDKFDNLIDLAVNPNEKEIYVLNKTSVYEINL